MKKKNLIAALLALALIFSLAACSGGNNSNDDSAKEPASSNESAETAGGEEEKTEDKEETKEEEETKDEETSEDKEDSADPTFENVKISAGSGTAGGGQYVYVGGITNIINTYLDGVEVILEATQGSGENLALLQSGEMEVASIESSIAYNAMVGVDLEEGAEPFPEVRSIFASLPTHFIITTLDPDVDNVEDLVGHPVAFGPYTGSTDISSRAVFKELGLLDQMDVVNAGWGDCFTSMGDGQVYAVTGGSIHPASAITELEATYDVNFVEFTEEQMDQLTEAYPYYKRVSLPADMYKGLTEDYDTIGAWQAMYTSANVDEDLIYMFTKTVFEHLDLLEATHSGGLTTRLENIGEQPVPLHMGAYRYYKEMGVEVPEELLPPELSEAD